MIELNAAARILTAKLDPWAQKIFEVIKSADKKARADDMSDDEGYATGLSQGKKIEQALKAAGLKAKKLGPNFDPGNAYASLDDKRHGVNVQYPEDEDEAVIRFY